MLITFEGIDGSGKSTQIQLLHEKLVQEGYPVSVFREPGGTKISEKIRELLLDQDNDIDPVTEALLFSSARSRLVSEVLKPRIQAGEMVILDRYYDSTVAYQGYGRQALPLNDLHELNKIASRGLVPDITFYLKIDIEQSEHRRKDLVRDRMENSGLDFYRRVISGFDELAALEARIVVLEASGSVDHIADKIWQIIQRKIRGL
ncbi:MAG: dTMP kinase [Balneolales bacterium]